MRSDVYDYKMIRVDKYQIDEHLGYEIDEEIFDELVESYYPCDDGDFIRFWLKHIDDEVIDEIKDELEIKTIK